MKAVGIEARKKARAKRLMMKAPKGGVCSLNSENTVNGRTVREVAYLCIIGKLEK
jgi:hypothetical protein